MSLVVAISLMLSCGLIRENMCRQHKNKVKSFQEQRKILSNLRDEKKLGKKKFKAIDGLLKNQLIQEKKSYKGKCQ